MDRVLPWHITGHVTQENVVINCILISASELLFMHPFTHCFLNQKRNHSVILILLLLLLDYT